jgi:hypothetical protein
MFKQLIERNIGLLAQKNDLRLEIFCRSNPVHFKKSP